MRTGLLLRAAFVGTLLGGLVFTGWIYAGDGHGVLWLGCGALLSATAAALAGGIVLVFHTPSDRSEP
ncbi:hypothetical protein Afil01_29640 [Actinorhabdospora filicis]|uniref:Uncharacterized protein n=1 Tax=Actinorhabdospora filicis TaxID=1785913 RepID=A0A9W6W3H3_9ACTN|nr:hypothetical protein [Actinorhabdospora filicis]GLZ78157.1 hypothetical protein Afil01_29640 [Actinorhabdospora filicis]